MNEKSDYSLFLPVFLMTMFTIMMLFTLFVILVIRERPDIEEILSIGDETRRFNAVLEAELGISGPADDAYEAIFRTLLAHHHYLRGNTASADAYVESLPAGRIKKSDFRSRKLEAGVEEALHLLFLFHRGRRALTRGRSEIAAELISEEFFQSLGETGTELRSVPEHSWLGDALFRVEGDAADLLVEALYRDGSVVQAEIIRPYLHLWERRGTGMEERRLVSLLLLALETGSWEEAGGAKILKRWYAERPFNPETSEIFLRLCREAGIEDAARLAEAEIEEYFGPFFEDGEGIRGDGPGAVAENREGEEFPFEGAPGRSEERHRHRFTRYREAAETLERAAQTGEDFAAALENYLALEPLFSSFQDYYRRLWRILLAFGDEREAQAIVAIRRGITAAPHTAAAREGRRLLWELRGPPSATRDDGVLPLLEEELAEKIRLIGLGADPCILNPVLDLLSFPDNIHGLQAELTIRELRDEHRVRRYLFDLRDGAEGRLRERLDAILR